MSVFFFCIFFVRLRRPFSARTLHLYCRVSDGAPEGVCVCVCLCVYVCVCVRMCVCTQFTCFASRKVQILTQEARIINIRLSSTLGLRARSSLAFRRYATRFTPSSRRYERHTSPYVTIRHHTSAYVSMTRFTPSSRRYENFLLYQYKSTNTDAESGATQTFDKMPYVLYK